MLLSHGQPKSLNEVAKEALEQMKTALVDAQTNLYKAQERTKRVGDKWRRSETYKVGNEVVLTIANLCSYCPCLPPKIKAHWGGPFFITQEKSPFVYGLDLPPSWRIHPSFYVSKLKRYIHSEEFLQRLSHRLLYLWGTFWSMKSRGFCSIRVRKLVAVT